MSADEEVNVRLFKEEVEAVRFFFPATERRDIENVDRGALQKVGQHRRRRGIFVGHISMLWCGERLPGKGTAGTTLVRSLNTFVPVNDDPTSGRATTGPC
jgi:hypothetical protein